MIGIRPIYLNQNIDFAAGELQSVFYRANGCAVIIADGGSETGINYSLPINNNFTRAIEQIGSAYSYPGVLCRFRVVRCFRPEWRATPVQPILSSMFSGLSNQQSLRYASVDFLSLTKSDERIHTIRSNELLPAQRVTHRDVNFVLCNKYPL